ncbi:DNA polymerase [Dethiosulfovibrio salsuginis]|uniref:DNA-directed DNA polymerase n=1 Tax=Dethiosulfovibrio salsuginis TaxID=561720 RepID=A0A1X7JJT4_9BACT|nr:DNA polymerase [Dethiosulfovibrio salsuginis]SMG28411.1 DNA polymerase I [Dethiosulfovibrio salsuginis]
MSGPVMLIDGHGLAYRAFYAVPELTAPDGTPTNALVGFFNMMARLKKQWKPTSLSVVFDAPGPTFRHEMFKEYKAGRKPTPEEFKVQLPILKDMIDALGIPVLSKEGVEADDVLGAMAREMASRGTPVLVVTSDKDMLQILDEGITVVRPGKGITSFKSWDRDTFISEYGFLPERMADYLALVGDTADNVPGVPGIGDKTARRLLSSYGSLDGIYANLDGLTPSQRKKFEENSDLVRKSLVLTTLCSDCIPEGAEVLADRGRFMSLCRDMGMKVLEKILPDLIEEEVWETMELEPDVPCVSPLSPLSLQPVSLESLMESEKLAVHSIWSGEYPMDVRPERIALCDPTGRYWEGDRLPDKVIEALSRKSLITSDYKRLFASSIIGDRCPEIWDLRSVDYLLHPDRSSHDLWTILGDQVPSSMIGQTAELWSLKDRFSQSLSEMNLSGLLSSLDLPLVPVLVRMEKRGIAIDRGGMEGVIVDLEARIKEISEHISSMAGEINLNSPKQVGELLFNRLGLPPIKKTKTGYSTDVTVLEQLAELSIEQSEIPRLLLEHREISKMLSGFAVPLLKADRDGIIHSTFEADTTGTGRLSSRDPNLQNLPVYGEWSQRICKCLVPKGKDRCFVAADYSQIELRILAHISGEPRLLEVFEKGRDIHTETAAMVFGLDPSLVTKELRRSAKMVAFGLLYGMSAFGLAKRLGVGQAEAKDIMSRYFKALPGVEAYMTKSSDMAISSGYTETLLGRRRPLNEVETGNARDKGHMKRVAINSPIQGTAADLAKKAMIEVDRSLQGGEMVLQVHDSIVCECHCDDREEVMRSLQNIMESAASLSVPLVTEGKIGDSLSEV